MRPSGLSCLDPLISPAMQNRGNLSSRPFNLGSLNFGPLSHPPRGIIFFVGTVISPFSCILQILRRRRPEIMFSPVLANFGKKTFYGANNRSYPRGFYWLRMKNWFFLFAVSTPIRTLNWNFSFFYTAVTKRSLNKQILLCSCDKAIGWSFRANL